MCHVLLDAFHTLTNLVLTKPYEVGTLTTPTLEMKKLRQIEAKQHVCAHTYQRVGVRESTMADFQMMQQTRA